MIAFLILVYGFGIALQAIHVIERDGGRVENVGALGKLLVAIGILFMFTTLMDKLRSLG